MTNKEWMATLTVEQFYDEMLWLIRDFGFRFNNTRLGIIDWLDQPYMPEKNYKIINATTTQTVANDQEVEKK